MNATVPRIWIKLVGPEEMSLLCLFSQGDGRFVFTAEAAVSVKSPALPGNGRILAEGPDHQWGKQQKNILQRFGTSKAGSKQPLKCFNFQLRLNVKLRMV